MTIGKKVLAAVKVLVLFGMFSFVVAKAIAPPKIDEAPPVHVRLLNGQSKNLADPDEKTVMVFWASWCPPCKLELARLNKLVESKPHMAKRIIAVSIGEPAELVRKTAGERGYKFEVASDEAGEAAVRYKIEGTPTIILKNPGNGIKWMTAGISPSLEMRVLEHLSD